jgi:hypothetical protein
MTMTILEFFTQIRDSAITLRNKIGVKELYKVNETNQKLDILIGHAEMLVLQASREKPFRRWSVIQSSWSTVRLHGKTFGLFEKYANNSGLRQRLSEFFLEVKSQ